MYILYIYICIYYIYIYIYIKHIYIYIHILCLVIQHIFGKMHQHATFGHRDLVARPPTPATSLESFECEIRT